MIQFPSMSESAFPSAQFRINSSNAVAMAKLRWVRHRERKLAEASAKQFAPESVAESTHDPMRAETLLQLSQIDKRISELKGAKLAKELPGLCRAKQTLWALLFPKPINQKQARKRSQSSAQFQPVNPLQT